MANYVWPSLGGSGGFINGGGSANEVTYFQSADTLAGDSKFVFNPTWGGFGFGNSFSIDTGPTFADIFNFGQNITDFSASSDWRIFTEYYTLDPDANITTTSIIVHDFESFVPNGDNGSTPNNKNLKDITNFYYYINVGGSGHIDLLINAQNGCIINGTRTCDENYAYLVQSGHFGTGGNIVEDISIQIQTPAHGNGGTMTTHKGLEIQNQEFGTNSWAIDVLGGKVQFGAPSGQDSLLYFQDGDVAHGMTSIVPTDVYGQLTAQSSTAGGLRVAGLSDNDSSGLNGYGIIGTSAPSNTTPSIVFRGLKKNGTTAQDLGGSDVLFAVVNNNNDSFPGLWMTGGGSMSIRTQFANARFEVSSSTSDSTASSMKATDSGDGTAIFLARNDKRIGFGTSTLNSTGEFLSKTASSGITKIATFTGATHTGITSATEANWFDVAPNQTHTWTAGSVTTQRAAVFRAETIAATGASIFTNAATLAVTDAPTAGSNVTITNPFAFWVQAGSARFDGIVDVSGIAASSAAIKTVATSDTPGVTFSVAGTISPDFAPAGFMKINVGGSSRYIPFWA